MLTLPPRILLARDPVDLRKQIDGLAAICEVHPGEQPLGGTLFVFRNSRATALKMLVWSHGGFTLLHKERRGTHATRWGLSAREFTPAAYKLRRSQDEAQVSVP